MIFYDRARDELTQESNLLRQSWTGKKSDYWDAPAAMAVTKKPESAAKAHTGHEHDLVEFLTTTYQDRLPVIMLNLRRTSWF